MSPTPPSTECPTCGSDDPEYAGYASSLRRQNSTHPVYPRCPDPFHTPPDQPPAAHLRVYVAGRTKELHRVRLMMKVLEAAGCEITFDWTGAEGEIRSDWTEAADRGRELSERELEAVGAADAVVLLWSQREADYGVGCLLETGMALALGKPVVVAGAARESVFWYLPNVQRVEHDAAVLDVLPPPAAHTPARGEGASRPNPGAKASGAKPGRTERGNQPRSGVAPSTSSPASAAHTPGEQPEKSQDREAYTARICPICDSELVTSDNTESGWRCPHESEHLGDCGYCGKPVELPNPGCVGAYHPGNQLPSAEHGGNTEQGERGTRKDDGWRLYLLLALFDRRDGSVLADLVRSAREGYERSNPEMGPAENPAAWDKFDAVWGRYSQTERLRLSRQADDGERWLLYWEPGKEKWPRARWGDSPRLGAEDYVTVEVAPLARAAEAERKLERLRGALDRLLSQLAMNPDLPPDTREARAALARTATDPEEGK